MGGVGQGAGRRRCRTARRPALGRCPRCSSRSLVALTLLLPGCERDGDGAKGAPAGANKVTFTTEDGVQLGGYLVGEGSRGVVLAHMYPTDQTSWFAYAEELAQPGYLVLTFDFRGYGESQGAVPQVAAPKDLAVYPGDAHGTDLLTGPQAVEVKARLAAFLETALGNPTG